MQSLVVQIYYIMVMSLERHIGSGSEAILFFKTLSLLDWMYIVQWHVHESYGETICHFNFSSSGWKSMMLTFILNL